MGDWASNGKAAFVVTCLAVLTPPAAASEGVLFAWGSGGTGGGGGGGQGGGEQPRFEDPCESLLGGTAVASLSTVQFDVLPQPYRLADCLDKKKKKKGPLKGGVRYDQGPPVQQYPPPGTYYPPPQYVDPNGNVIPPPPPPPPPPTYDGGVAGGGAPPPPLRPYNLWGNVRLGTQWVKWTMPINSTQQGQFPYPSLPLYSGNTVVAYANATVTVRGHSVNVQMSSPIPYAWNFTIPRGY